MKRIIFYCLQNRERYEETWAYFILALSVDSYSLFLMVITQFEIPRIIDNNDIDYLPNQSLFLRVHSTNYTKNRTFYVALMKELANEKCGYYSYETWLPDWNT